MDTTVFDVAGIDVAWCPGCGNFSILKIVKEALASMDTDPARLVMVSGIGQAAKLPQYLKSSYFNGLHGRALPAATAIKAANPELSVVVTSGDGDIYGEGGNHLIHAIRRNPDITVIVHDNMVYGLTKGQASPTSQQGLKTPLQVEGVAESPFNPMAFAVAMDASFVARASSGDPAGAVEIVKKALSHRGFALVDMFQPCVTFNKVNTYQWFKSHTYYLEDSYDPSDRAAAFRRAIETDRLPLGVFYVSPDKPVFNDTQAAYRENREPLYRRNADRAQKIRQLMTAAAG